MHSVINLKGDTGWRVRMCILNVGNVSVPVLN